MTTDAEKAAEEWAKSYAYMMPNTNLCKERVLAAQEEGFLAGAAWAESKWISVKERLPEECCDVLAAIWDPHDRVHWYDILGWGGPDVNKWIDYEMATHDHITHWMPLPAAPKEEK